MNICEHLSATAKIFPDRIAIRFEGTSISYAQLDRMCEAAGQVLSTAGIKSGDRVTVMLANVPAFAVWYYAALRVGAIAVSVSTRSAPAEVGYLTKDCGARFFVSDRATLETVAGELPDSLVRQIYTSDIGDTVDGGPLPPIGQNSAGWVDADPSDPAVILYTSGTTGFAKGAVLSHMNVRSNVCAFNHLCGMNTEDRILLAVPLFHCFGQNALLNSALNVGATLVLQRRFDLNESKRLIADESVTQLYGVPMMFQLFLDSCEKADLATVNYCFSAAATLPVQVGERWRQNFGRPIHEGYGLTETSPFASYNHRDRFVCGSIGAPIDNVEMKVVDTETREECPRGDLGEIIIRGPNVMLGYWNRDHDTREVLRDGWFYSGDIGRVDEDGFFYIVDRVKDMIAVGGLKVFPAEVERVLLDHAAIDEVAVVGIPDDVFGEQVVAFVVMTDEAEGDQADTKILASMTQHAKSQLANYKVPRLMVPIPTLPRNPSGKILKRELRQFDLTAITGSLGSTNGDERASDEESDVGSFRPLHKATLRRLLAETHASERRRVADGFVQQLVKTVSDLDELPEADARFLEAGLDSLMIVEISHQLQVELGPDHEVPATLVFDHPRICDLSGFLVNTLMPEAKNSDDIGDRSDQSTSAQPTDSAESNDLRTEIESLSEDEALAELMREME